MFSTDATDDGDFVVVYDSPEATKQRRNGKKNASTLEEPGPMCNIGSIAKARKKKNPKGVKARKEAAEPEGVSGGKADSGTKGDRKDQDPPQGKTCTSESSLKETPQTKRSGFFMRNRLLHSRFYGDLWEDCDTNDQKRTREEVGRFLDELAQNGHNANFLLAAAFKIQKRAKLASDYHPDNVSEGGDTLGPLTLVIPMIRYNTKIDADNDLYKLSNFLCSLSTEDPDGGSDTVDPNDEDLKFHKEEDDDLGEFEEKQEEDTASLKNESGDDTLVNDLLNLRFQSLFSSPFLFWRQPDKLTLEHRRQAFFRKSEEERIEEARYLSKKLKSTLFRTDLERVVNTIQQYIDKSEPGVVVVRQDIPEQKIADSSEKDGFDSKQQRILNTHLFMSSKAHFHWFASDFAQFLDYEAGSTAPNGYLFENDPQVKKSQKLWARKRDETVDILMDIQERLLHSIEKLRKFLHTGDDTKDRTKEEEAFVIDLHSIRKKRKSQSFHSRYEAALEQRDFVFPTAPRFMVMVDNLPIDVTHEQLDRWYSRCGKINSISIQNQRPELDPGHLPKEKLKELRNTLRTKDFSFTRNTQLRSPVYALLDFADNEGYKKATQLPLSVFGMVVQRHAIRSTPLQRLRSLFIHHLDQENMQKFLFEKAQCSVKIRFPLDAINIGSELQKRLDPLWVSLETGEDGHKVLGSCEVQFPSFETAWYAYEKLTKDGEWDHVHWIQSPKDSMEWWTRKRGFYI